MLEGQRLQDLGHSERTEWLEEQTDVGKDYWEVGAETGLAVSGVVPEFDVGMEGAVGYHAGVGAVGKWWEWKLLPRESVGVSSIGW